MFLSKLVLNLRSRRVRRDIASPYEMHRTLARVFAETNETPPKRFLWRLEAQVVYPFVLVQSESCGHWGALPEGYGYLEGEKSLKLERLVQKGRHLRFLLRANPTVCQKGKRYGLLKQNEQVEWLQRQGHKSGFIIPTINREKHPVPQVEVFSEFLRFKKGKSNHWITLLAVCFEGVLEVTDTEALLKTVANGLGHAKAFGLGMLSLAPWKG